MTTNTTTTTKKVSYDSFKINFKKIRKLLHRHIPNDRRYNISLLFCVLARELSEAVDSNSYDKKYIEPMKLWIQIHSRLLRTTSVEGHLQIGVVFTNMVMKVWMTGKIENGENIVIGYARPDTLQWVCT
jgi:hypothetical protein